MPSQYPYKDEIIIADTIKGINESSTRIILRARKIFIPHDNNNSKIYSFMIAKSISHYCLKYP